MSPHQRSLEEKQDPMSRPSTVVGIDGFAWCLPFSFINRARRCAWKGRGCLLGLPTPDVARSGC